MWYIIANTILIILFSIIGYWIGRYDRENKTKEYMQKYYEDVKNSDVLLSIAQKYSVTASSVNLTIRKSIELTWLSSKLNTKHKMFECSCIETRFPPTNSEFIATMVEIIRINLRENDKSVDI